MWAYETTMNSYHNNSRRIETMHQHITFMALQHTNNLRPSFIEKKR
jgi:hypothetical protein